MKSSRVAQWMGVPDKNNKTGNSGFYDLRAEGYKS